MSGDVETDLEWARCAKEAERIVLRNGEVDVRRLSGEERMALVLEMSRLAWELTGRPEPNLPRPEWPGRVIRPE